MINIEVRCCCDAHLIGWVPITRMPLPGKTLIFALDPPRGRRPWKGDAEMLAFEVATVETRCDVSELMQDLAIKAEVLNAKPPYVALKSNDHPIEQLRRIHGFVEASPAEIKAAG